MVTLTNYNSGELLIGDDSSLSVRLDREEANRLILLARMHASAEFAEKLPSFISDKLLVGLILKDFEKKSSTERWNLKEKFARLHTLSKDYEPVKSEEIVEVVPL